MDIFKMGHEGKDFHLGIGGELFWTKWLKNGLGKCLSFMQLFLVAGSRMQPHQGWSQYILAHLAKD